LWIQSSSVLTAQHDNGLWISVVRGDGILVPVGYLDSNIWTSQKAHPDFWDSQMLSGKWHFLALDGRESTLTAGIAVKYAVWDGDTSWGLVTNYSPHYLDMDPGFDPMPKAGVASNRPIRLVSMNPIDSTKEDWRILTDILLPSFRLNEPDSLIWLVNAPLQVRIFKGSRDTCCGKKIYCYELMKNYYATYATLVGFVVVTPSETTLVQNRFSIGDKELAPEVDPFCLFSVSGRLFLVGDVIPYEGAYSCIFELTQKGFEERVVVY
jgi:hypothetical protein